MKQLGQTTGYAVRFKTELCDRHGRVIRELQRGRNMITDWGMNLVATKPLFQCLTNLLLSSNTEVLKRVLPGGNSVTVNYANPAAVIVTAASNFFGAGDAGATLKIAGWPEMRITGYTSQTEVTCSARGGAWIPGFTPSSAGPYTDVGVHFTNKATLGTYGASVTTFDTSATNFNAEISDYANGRFIEQRIWLSDVVTGSPWTINQLGWSDTNGSFNCFGKANLAAPDVVAVGKRYRVTLQVFNAYTPINLTGVTLDFGGTIGSYTADIRQERIGLDDPGLFGFTRPFFDSSPSTNHRAGWVTSASPTLQTTKYEGDPSWATITRTRSSSAVNGITDGAYTTDTHTRGRILTWGDTLAISGATALEAIYQPNANLPLLTIIPTTTFNKAVGYMARLTFPIHWTRELVN